MNEPTITIQDLDNILVGKYHIAVILDLAAKHFEISTHELIKNKSRKFAYRSDLIFLLRYLGVPQATVSEVMMVCNKDVYSNYHFAKQTFFKEPKTIDLFLFVLTELRKIHTT